MTGAEYEQLIADYIAEHFDLTVRQQVTLGRRALSGQRRRLDILAQEPGGRQALALECKYQAVSGTTEEKLVNTLRDLELLGQTNLATCLVYAGDGFSAPFRSLLEGDRSAVYCLPEGSGRTPATAELDELLATVFGRWEWLP